MSLAKVRIWDRLVDALGGGPEPVPAARQRPSAAQLDTMINGVRATLQRRGLLPESGSFVNVLA